MDPAPPPRIPTPPSRSTLLTRAPRCTLTPTPAACEEPFTSLRHNQVETRLEGSLNRRGRLHKQTANVTAAKAYVAQLYAPPCNKPLLFKNKSPARVYCSVCLFTGSYRKWITRVLTRLDHTYVNPFHNTAFINLHKHS